MRLGTPTIVLEEARKQEIHQEVGKCGFIHIIGPVISCSGPYIFV